MNILMIGFGSIGQGLVPLLKGFKVHVVTADDKGIELKSSLTSHTIIKLTRKNYKKVLAQYSFDLLINVSVEVSSVALMKWCQKNAKLYIDTCIEPWKGGYINSNKERTTNYYLRHRALQVKGPHTAVVAHGANPGLVSHFVKAALEELKNFFKLEPASYPELAHTLGIQVVQVAEEDTQISSQDYGAKTFVNTWSVDGFVSELKQYAELGTSEKNFGKYKANQCSFGDVSVYLNKPSYQTPIKSWVPSSGNHTAYLITHHEATSISNMLEYKGVRPTVYYAYKPCPQALKNWHLLDTKIKKQKIIKNEITSGHDELGILLVSRYFSYWFGSVLDHTAVKIPHNSATSLQVTISLYAAIQWMIKNPLKGVVEAEDIDHHYVLSIAKPYLGEYGGVFTDFKIKSLKFKDFV